MSNPMTIGSDVVLFCFAAIVLIVTPGPNFLYVLTRGAAEGRRAGLVAACGLGVGVLIHTRHRRQPNTPEERRLL
jgi:threonine/homoserine/homoserine lactone efflux protein